MPFDPVPELEGQLLAVLAPGPAFGEVGYDRVERVLLLVLVEQHKVVEHRHQHGDRGARHFLVDRHRGRASEIRHLEDAARFLRQRRVAAQPERQRRCNRDGNATRTSHHCPSGPPARPDICSRGRFPANIGGRQATCAMSDCSALARTPKRTPDGSGASAKPTWRTRRNRMTAHSATPPLAHRT